MALAVLRQPVKTSATIANPAMTAARMVRSLTDTQQPTLVSDPALPAPRPRAAALPGPFARIAGAVVFAVAVTTLVAIAALALLPAQLVANKQVADRERPGEMVDEETPYALVPSGAEAVADRVSYGDDLGDAVEVDTDLNGRVFFVTVSEPPQSVLGYLVSGDEPAIEFLTRDEKFGSQTPSQERRIQLQMMRTSSQVAQYIALDRAGFGAAEIRPGPVQVWYFLCREVVGDTCGTYVESAEVLDEGDTLVEVDGEPIANLDDLTAALADNEVGDTVEITVEHIDGGEATVEVELIAASTDPANDRDYLRPIIGFVPFDTRSIDLPFEINIDTGEIGGPSAGLAFTLTLLDELTDGDLLGGADVAVTGTIELDGSVGAIGALAQKVSAVRQAGIEYFIVPAAQGESSLAAAREVAGDDVTVIPVETIDEALAELVELGGDPLATS